jgi:hypothetical protein
MNDLMIIGIAIFAAMIFAKFIIALDDHSDGPRGRKPTRKK